MKVEKVLFERQHHDAEDWAAICRGFGLRGAEEVRECTAS